VTRYIPSRNYLTAGIVAAGLAVLSACFALQWTPASIPAVLFAISGLLLFFLAFRPVIEIHPHHLRIGDKVIPWQDIQRVDRTGWVSPLIVHLTMLDSRRLLVIHPGDYDSSNQLLRHLRRAATSALIDGQPYGQFWSEPAAIQIEDDEPGTVLPPPNSRRYPLLRPEDEADIERLYQRLKAVGRLDPKDEG